MLKYKIVTIETKELESVTCDICKREFSATGNELGVFPQDIIELQEMQHMSDIGGYGSVFGDETHWAIDICQHCLKEKLGMWIRIIE